MKRAVVGVLGLALVADVSGNLSGANLLSMVSHHWQFALWCVSLALLIWGMSSAPVFLPLSIGWRGSWGVRFVVLAITVFALVLRLWQLEESIRFLVDDGNFALAVGDLRVGFHVPLLAPFRRLAAFPWLYPYLQAHVVNLFGRDLASLRTVSALFGAFTIPALYLLAKTLFDRRTAVLAALLLAAFPPHIHFSRFALNNIADPLFGTLTLAFLARGLKDGRRLDYVLGGVSLGLTQYFYEGGRLLFPLLVALWLAAIVIARRLSPPLHRMERGAGGEVKSQRHLLAFALAALIVAAPIYATLYGLRLPPLPRVNVTGFSPEYWQNLLLAPAGSGALQAHLQHTLNAFAVYTHALDTSRYYDAAQPMLLIYLTPFFLLGIIYALRHLRTAGILLLWLFLVSAGNTLLNSSTHYSRYVAVFPAVTLLTALGISVLLSLLDRLPRTPRYAVTGALIAALVAGQIIYYFGHHLPAYGYNYWLYSPHDGGQDAARRSLSFPPGTRIHIVSTVTYPDFNEDTTYLRVYTDDLDLYGMTSDMFTDEYLANLPHDIDHAFFLEPEDEASRERLAAHFSLLEPQYSPYRIPPEKQFVLYYAPSIAP